MGRWIESNTHFVGEIYGVQKIDLRGSRELVVGAGGRKFSGVNVEGKGFGFDRGFAIVGRSDEVALERYKNWLKLIEMGLGSYTFGEARLAYLDLDGINSLAFLTQDLETKSCTIVSNNSYKSQLAHSKLASESTRWLWEWMNSNRSLIEKATRGRVLRKLPGYIKSSFSEYFAAGYTSREIFDPYLELEVGQITGNFPSFQAENIYILISKTHDRRWPYKRTPMIGDLGGDLFGRKYGCLPAYDVVDNLYYWDRYM